MTDEQRDILVRAASLLAESERLRRLVRDNDTELRALCRAYDKHFGVWGAQPHHLRRTVDNHGMTEVA